MRKKRERIESAGSGRPTEEKVRLMFHLPVPVFHLCGLFYELSMPTYIPGEKVVYQDQIHTVLSTASDSCDLRGRFGSHVVAASHSLIAPLIPDKEMKRYKELREKMGDYTEAQLVSFGNYMLNQDKRKRKEQVRSTVTHADRCNWEHSRKK